MARNPTGPEWPVGTAEAGERLDKFLAAPERLASRARAARAIQHGQVFLNGAEAAATGARLAAGDLVRLWLDRPGSAKPRRSALGDRRDLAIVFEDDAIVVLDKPPGVLAVPLERKAGARSVYADLSRHLSTKARRKPFVVHRIDRDTSGLVVFAKRADVQQRLKEQFSRHEPERVYHAIVHGRPDPPAGVWRDRLVWDERALVQRPANARDRRAAEAVSRYRVLDAFARASLLEVRLVTGKRNQIRIQAGLRGHPIVGERRYIYDPAPARPIPFPRQALHAWRLAFRHPLTGEPLVFEAPEPPDLRDLLNRLRRVRP